MKSSISNTDNRLLSSLFVLVLLFLFNSTAVKLMTLYVNQFLTFNSPRCCFNPAKPVVGRSCSPSYGPVRVLKLEFLRTILERTGAMSCQSQRSAHAYSVVCSRLLMSAAQRRVPELQVHEHDSHFNNQGHCLRPHTSVVSGLFRCTLFGCL